MSNPGAGERKDAVREEYPFEQGVDVPADIGVCPYCDAPLRAQAVGWDDVGGRWVPDMIGVDCTREPDPDVEAGAWDDWWEIHRQMPYVYQLPVDERVKDWMRTTVLGPDPLAQQPTKRTT